MSEDTRQRDRVLLVDANGGLLDMLTALLARADDRLAVETATDGQAALRRLAEGSVDCVVAGYDLPDMDGRELFTAVRELDPDVGFVLLSHREPPNLPDGVAADVDAAYQKVAAVDRFPELTCQIRSLVREGQTATTES